MASSSVSGDGQREAVLGDEPAQGAAVALLAQAGRQQGDENIASGFVPGAEAAGGHAVADAFAGAAEPGELPVVNGARAVGGQVGEPAVAHHAVEDHGRAVAEQVGAVDEHHAGPPAAGGPDASGNLIDGGRQRRRQRPRRRGRIDENFVGDQEVPSLGQRKDPQATQIQRRPRPAHAALLLGFWCGNTAAASEASVVLRGGFPLSIDDESFPEPGGVGTPVGAGPFPDRARPFKMQVCGAAAAVNCGQAFSANRGVFPGMMHLQQPGRPFMTKHIFVTGGVVSSLGKGLTSASIGMLLEQRGLSVRMQKLDPYINVDPGTMSPYQHGEVYVLDDGSETDLDLGHYERFTNSPLNRHSNYTTGQIYLSVINKERRGEFLGQTVQVIPHVTNEIKSALSKLDGPGVDVVISEIGGTVGDIESQPFLEAIRQFSLDVGKENCLYIHLTLVPYLKAAAELKTKPTQHSVGLLRQIGIQPDILVCRTERSLRATTGRRSRCSATCP